MVRATLRIRNGFCLAAITVCCTMVKLGPSRAVDGVKVTLADYAVGRGKAPGVPSPKPGHRFLQTHWSYQNDADHVVVLGKTQAISGGRTYEARMFGGPANIGALRPGQEGYARWWFEVPVTAREVQLVYESPDGARGVWNLSMGSAAK